MDPSTLTNIATALSANRARSPLQRQRQDDQKTAMNKVKQLYLERQYKQCIALCEAALKDNASEVALTS